VKRNWKQMHNQKENKTVWWTHEHKDKNIIYQLKTKLATIPSDTIQIGTK